MLDPYVAPSDPDGPDGPGAEPAYCPACELQHVRRPDWLCPRCGSPVETGPRRPRARGRAAAEDVREFPLGSLVAGALMTATGLVLAIGVARDPTTAHRWPLVGAAALLAVLGLELLLKVSAARWIVVVVAAAAALVASDDLVRARLPELTRDPVPSAVRLPLHDALGAVDPARTLLAVGLVAGILLLVIGRPRRARLAAGALLAAALAVAEVVRAILS